MSFLHTNNNIHNTLITHTHIHRIKFDMNKNIQQIIEYQYCKVDRKNCIAAKRLQWENIKTKKKTKQKKNYKNNKQTFCCRSYFDGK